MSALIATAFGGGSVWMCGSHTSKVPSPRSTKAASSGAIRMVVFTSSPLRRKHGTWVRHDLRGPQWTPPPSAEIQVHEVEASLRGARYGGDRDAAIPALARSGHWRWPLPWRDHP